ncbi:MAG: phosphodiesterase [Phycisphaerae bacterium]|jgi:phosphoesterase RecJ-like protein|nr:MAG: phosphodiesterase [Phycisphaerae bacterium]
MKDLYQTIIERLSSTKKVLVTTHVRPDGDALGSSAALVLALRSKGIQAKVLLLSHLPTKYSFVFRESEIDWIDVETGFSNDFSVNDYDTLVVVDTGTWSQLPGLKPYVQAFRGTTIVIDHHQTQEDWADEKLVIPEAAATGEIVAELLEQWDVDLDVRIATSIFVALVSDTGWFQFSSTRPFTLRLAAQLIEAGVDTDRLYQLIYQNERAERLLLHTLAMQSLELLADNRLALMQVRRRDFLDTDAGVNDTENLINIPLQIRTVQVSVLLVEPPEGGPIRVSFRSKGTLNCARFAEQFQGGGHHRAAGAKLETSLETARHRVVAALMDHFATDQSL